VTYLLVNRQQEDVRMQLAARDLTACLAAVGALGEATAGGEGFARQGVLNLPRLLVASELTHLSICDLDTGHRNVVSDIPGAISKPQVDVFDRYFHDNPLVRAHGRNPRAITHRISDLQSATDFRRSPLFNEYYRSIGIDHAIAVPIHVRDHRLVSFVFNRKGRDFSDRDRACLESIRPHLGDLYRLSGELEGPRAAWGVPAALQPRPDDPRLTAREREVLHWLSGGKTDRDIAQILAISPRTVHKHLQRIYEKLGVETRTAAVVRALSLGTA
jgi:DNA-binding CsgD family transcriptional regulator